QRGARALGILGAAPGLGVVLGPLVGGAVVQGLTWPWIFWVNIPVGLATIALTRARVGESSGPDPALDLPGLALVTGGAFGIVWALVRGNPAGWGSPEVTGALAAGSRWGPRSSPGSSARASRCCRCACSAPAHSRRATRRSS